MPFCRRTNDFSPSLSNRESFLLRWGSTSCSIAVLSLVILVCVSIFIALILCEVGGRAAIRTKGVLCDNTPYVRLRRSVAQIETLKT